MEAVAETSEEFLDRYFAGETFSENEIRQALRVNVSEGTIVPVMMGSNTMERGMYTLLGRYHQISAVTGSAQCNRYECPDPGTFRGKL